METKKLQKRSSGNEPHKNFVYQICLPKHMVKKLKWRKGMKLGVSLRGNSIWLTGVNNEKGKQS